MGLYELSDAQALALQTLVKLHCSSTAAIGLRTLPGLDEAFSPASIDTIGDQLSTPAAVTVAVFASGGVVQDAKSTHTGITFWLHDEDELDDCDLIRNADGIPALCQCQPTSAAHKTAIENAQAFEVLPETIF